MLLLRALYTLRREAGYGLDVLKIMLVHDRHKRALTKPVDQPPQLHQTIPNSSELLKDKLLRALVCQLASTYLKAVLYENVRVQSETKLFAEALDCCDHR